MAHIYLGTPNTNAFPKIESFLRIYDATGDFVHNLQSRQVNIIENDTQLPITDIQEQLVGVQIVIALDPGASFGIRNSQAISRYDYLKEALQNWATNRQGSTLDDMSLLITDGPSISHVSDSKQFLAPLENEQIDARTARPNLDTLFRALNLAADPSPRQGMGRAVLFITPPPEGQSEQNLEELTSQAIQQGIPIFVWMVSSSGALATRGAQRLTQLAEQSGGKFFAYTGEEALPDLETYLSPLRYHYTIAYQSQVTTSGTHQIAARVQLDTEPIDSNTQSFEINLQPPQPAFVSPPISIRRQIINDQELPDRIEDLTAYLTPKEVPVEVVFDFPDGRKRPIVHSALYVDGTVVAENFEAPFELFFWDLGSHTINGLHNLKVDVTDSLGLTGTSLEIPVQITVEQPVRNPWEVVQRNLPVISAAVVLLAGAILLLVLILGGQLRPRALRVSRSKRVRKVDPVTQPIDFKDDLSARRLSGWVNRLQWPQKHVTPSAYAYLSRVSEADDLSSTPPIPITATEMTLGSDPNQATLVLNDPSVEALHARLLRTEEGNFRLADQGSIAGTWINYTPISQEGARLEHGDLIHIGRIGFRFTLRQPTRIRKPVVTMDESDQESPKELPE